jgi:hypothetical protein
MRRVIPEGGLRVAFFRFGAPLVADHATARAWLERLVASVPRPTRA